MEKQRGGEEITTHSLSSLSRLPLLTHQGAGAPYSEFGGWGVAIALARLLAPRATPFSPSSGDNSVNKRGVVSLRGSETRRFSTLPAF
ncbi:MAG: hypothetical protein KF682_06545 [Nitrospira sp.]|nr:hypothetical protein [Nitrospira sp.]